MNSHELGWWENSEYPKHFWHEIEMRGSFSVPVEADVNKKKGGSVYFDSDFPSCCISWEQKKIKVKPKTTTEQWSAIIRWSLLCWYELF